MGWGDWEDGKQVTKPRASASASATPCCAATLSKLNAKTKPCRLLGGFSGEAGVTTIATGDEAEASDSPVGKDNPQRRAATHDAEAL